MTLPVEYTLRLEVRLHSTRKAILKNGTQVLDYIL